MAVKRTLRPSEAQIVRNVYHNIRLGVEQVKPHLAQETPIALCAGGPTLPDHIEDVRRLQLSGAEVVCVGNAGHTLTAAGIQPNGHVLMDGAKRNRSFTVPTPETRYFVASQCDPGVFETLRSHKRVYIWHAGGLEEEKEILTDWYGPGGYFLILGGSYITLRAITLLHVLGYRWMHIYGFDSCLREDDHHAYAQPNADGYRVQEVEMDGLRFRAQWWMLDQATQFVDSIKAGRFGEAELAIHGDGLIAHMVRSGSMPTWKLAA